MIYQVKFLRFPGTILHPKRGKIFLHKSSQKVLKELYDEGYPYVEAIEGKPIVEKEIKIGITPKVKPKKNKQKYSSPPLDSFPLPEDEASE